MDVKYLSTFKDFSPEKLKKNGVFQTARFFLDVYCLKVGQSQAAHVHAESDKVYLVLEGSCRFTVDGENAVHGSGPAGPPPPASPHRLGNMGPGAVRVPVLWVP